MGQTFGDLYREFGEMLDAKYRSEPERREAEIKGLIETVGAMLEILRDRLDPR